MIGSGLAKKLSRRLGPILKRKGIAGRKEREQKGGNSFTQKKTTRMKLR